MLVFERKLDEIIDIGDDTYVQVTSLYIDKKTGEPRCKIGVSAPQHIAVHRREITEEIARTGCSIRDAVRTVKQRRRGGLEPTRGDVA